MTLPATKARELVKRYMPILGGFDPVHEFTLRRIVREIQAVMADSDSLDQSSLFGLLGFSYKRMKDYANAENAFRNALARDRTNQMLVINVAAICIESKKYQDAKQVLSTVHAQSLSAFELFMYWGNRETVHRVLGENEQWHASYAKLLQAADLADPIHIFHLVVSAVGAGLDHDAIEYFARFSAVLRRESLGDTPALQYIAGLSEQDLARMSLVDGLEEAFARVRSAENDETEPYHERSLSLEESRVFADALLSPPHPTLALTRLFDDRAG